MSSPPYFEVLFSRLAAGDPLTTAAFGRHVHWGYWSEPSSALGTGDDYGHAAERLCSIICDQAIIAEGQKILDVGCGFGGTLASLNERFANLSMWGVNIDGRQLQRAKELITLRGNNTLELIQADAAQIPLPAASFDKVLAVECIFHFDRRAFMGEASRLLRPGGSLTLSDFVPDERAAEYIAAANLSGDEAIRWSYGQIDLSCSLNRYRELAAACGLKLAEETDITPHTLPTYDFLKKSMDDWPKPRDVDLFRRATGLLEKASRRGWLKYQVLRFDK